MTRTHFNSNTKTQVSDWIKEVIGFLSLVSSTAQKIGELFT